MTDDTKKRASPLPQAQPEPPPADEPLPDPIVSDAVTYLPGPEDPVQTQFAGHHFHANVPKQVRMPQSFFERVKGNRFFKVGAFDPQKDAVALREEPKEPRTSAEYKKHAVDWFKTVQSLHDFDARWVEEEAMRQSCDVGADDLDYLMSLARPKRAELQKKLRP